tara:strand:+ start:1101 stop:1886 length:786 start_codon:yes stop_codon:yes gene_type:complete
VGWLENQVVVITGCASGIGWSVAERFSREGAIVVCLDRNKEGLQSLKSVLVNDSLVAHGDASNHEFLSSAFADARREFGRIDCVIGNVGVFDWHKRLDKMSAEQLAGAQQEIFTTNVFSQLILAREAYQDLRRSKGSLILTCSTASFRGGCGGSLYTASKFAVRGLVMQLSKEWAPEVRVNGVAPGGTNTSLSGIATFGTSGRSVSGDPKVLEAISAATPLGFAANPQDHSGIYLLLASNENSRAMTGSVILSDGGLVASV